MPVLLAAVVGGLVVAAAYAGSAVLVLAVVGAQCLLAYGLMIGRGLPDTRRAGLLVVLTGIGAVVALRYRDLEPTGPTIERLLWVLGPAVVLALLLQLSRRDGRERLVESLAATVSGVLVTGLVAVLVPLRELDPVDELGVAFAASGAVLGTIAWWLGAVPPGRWRWPAWVLAGVLVVTAGAVLAVVELPDLSRDQGVVLGAAAGATGIVGAGAGHQLAADRAGRAVLMPVLGLALTGPAVYLATRVLFW